MPRSLRPRLRNDKGHIGRQLTYSCHDAFSHPARKDAKIRKVVLGKASISRENLLEIEIEGSDPGAAEGQALGLDCVIIE